jgi:DDE domain
MPCPHCGSPTTQQLKRTSLGYRTFRCVACRRRFNERSGTPFNDLCVPTDIVVLVVLWRLRYLLSLRHLAEMFLERGFVFSHETVRCWETLVAPLLTDALRARRRGSAGLRWHADETYVKVHGAWCYLYRAIDRDGNLVDTMLSQNRDMAAAKRFFGRALAVVGHPRTGSVRTWNAIQKQGVSACGGYGLIAPNQPAVRSTRHPNAQGTASAARRVGPSRSAAGDNESDREARRGRCRSGLPRQRSRTRASDSSAA